MFLIPDGRCEEHTVPGGGRHQLRVRGRHPLVDEVHVQDRRHPVRMWWVASTLSSRASNEGSKRIHNYVHVPSPG